MNELIFSAHLLREARLAAESRDLSIIHFARKHGLPIQEIADVLGVHVDELSAFYRERHARAIPDTVLAEAGTPTPNDKAPAQGDGGTAP